MKAIYLLYFKNKALYSSIGMIMFWIHIVNADNHVPKSVPEVRQYWSQVPVLTNKADNPVLRISIDVPDDGVEHTLEGIVLSAKGSTSKRDIKSIKVYYYGKDSTAGSMFQLKRPLFGQGTPKNKKTVVRGRQILHPGINNIWVSYQLERDTDLSHWVSAQCLDVQINGRKIKIESAGEPIRQRLGVAVRQHKQDNVHTSRIPGLATTNKGTLLAIFDARYESGRDLQGHMDIGVHRSTDGGKIWEPLQIAMDMGEWGGLAQKFNGVSDACILVDKNSDVIYLAGLWMHGVINEDGKWLEGLDENSEEWNHQWRNKGSQPGFGVKETSQFLIVKSTDDGKTWSAPVNITRMGKKEAWWLWAPAPGNGITLEDGTLVMPTQGRDESGKSFSNLTYSKDGGKTWVTTNPGSRNTTECAVVQLDDGSIMLNARFNRNKGNMGNDNGRAIYVTKDLGNTWTEHPSSYHALPEPVCMASLYKHVYRERNGSQKGILVFSNPNSKEFREDMTIKVSFDDGLTWPEVNWVLLDEWRGRGYSSLTSVGEDIGILYESSQADLVFQRLPLKELIERN